MSIYWGIDKRASYRPVWTRACNGAVRACELLPETLLETWLMPDEVTVQTFYSCASRLYVYQCWLYKHLWITCQKISQASTKYLACKSKLRSAVRSWSSMHPCTRNWLAIRWAVVYHARDARALSTGVKCWHCIIQSAFYFRPLGYLDNLRGLVINPYAAGGKFGKYRLMQKIWKMTETMAYGYSYESSQWELSNEYLHDRV